MRQLHESAPTKRVEALMETLTHALEAGNQEQAAILHFQAAHIWLAECDGVSAKTRPQRDEGKHHLQQACLLSSDPFDLHLLLSRLLEEEGAADDAAAELLLAIELLADGDEKALLLARAVLLYIDAHLLDLAIEVARRLSLCASSMVRLQRTVLERLLSAVDESGYQAAKPDVLRLLLGSLDEDEKPARIIALGALLEARGDDEGALRAYRAAVDPRAPDEGVLRPLEKLLETQSAYPELAQILESCARTAPSRQERSRLLLHLAALFDGPLASPARVHECLWAAWRSTPDPAILEQLKQNFTASQNWSEYQRVLLHELLSARTPESKIHVLKELASFQAEVLKDPKAATMTYGLVLQLCPAAEDTLVARMDLLARVATPLELARALRRLAHHTTAGPKREHYLRQLAELQRRENTDRLLVPTLQKLRPDDPQNLELLGQLEKWARETAVSPRTLFAISDLGLEMVRRNDRQGDAFVDEALHLAAAYTEAGSHGFAADLYRQVLARVPDHAPARAGLGRALRRTRASRGAETPPAPPDEHGATPRGASAQAAPQFDLTLAAAWQALVQEPAAGAEHADLARTLLVERAEEVMACAPATDEAAFAIEALLRAGALHELLETHLTAWAARPTTTPAQRRELSLALGQLILGPLKAPERALPLLAGLCEAAPEDRELVNALRDACATANDYRPLAAVLEQSLAAVDAAERGLRLAELAHLHETRLESPDLALSCYQKLLRAEPTHAEALAYCKSRLRDREQFAALADILRDIAERSEDVQFAALQLTELAEIAERQLKDPALAARTWHQVVRLTPGDRRGLDELSRLLAELRCYRELRDILLLQLVRARDTAGRVVLYQRLADLHANELEDPREAMRYLAAAQRADPENPRLLSQLAESFEHSGKWRKLSSTLEQHAAVAVTAEQSRELLMRAAHVRAGHLGQYDKALELCHRVRQLAPHDKDAVRLIGRIYSKRKEWTKKLALLNEQLSLCEDPVETGRLHIETGRLLIDQLNDPEGAVVHFEKALDHDAESAGELLPLLVQLYESQNRFDLVAELLRNHAARTALPSTERAQLLAQAGSLLRDRVGDVTAARALFDQALALDPSQRSSLTALREIAQHEERWGDAAALVSQELAGADSPRQKTELQLLRAEILHTHLHEPRTAAESLEEALKLAPDQLVIAEHLGLIYFELEDWKRTISRLEIVVHSGGADRQLHVHYYRLGYAAEKLGQKEEAFSSYVKSFSREPMFLPTLDRLVEFCYERHQWDNTLRIAAAIVTNYPQEKTTQELGELHFILGLCELHLAQREVAARKLQELVLEHGEMPRSAPEGWVDAAESWAATALDPALMPHVDQESLERVAKAMDRTLAHTPNHAGAHQVLAAVALVNHDWNRCISYLDRAADATVDDPKFEAALLTAAGDLSYRHLLSRFRAEAYFKRALERLPKSEQILARLAMLEENQQPGRDESTQRSSGINPAVPAPRSGIIKPPALPALEDLPTNHDESHPFLIDDVDLEEEEPE